MGYRLGIDIGGTFTDFVLVDEAGNLSIAKAESNPDRPSEAIRQGLEHLSRDLGMEVRDFVSRCRLSFNGSTVAINALIRHDGARTGLLCTKGFRDVIEIRLGYKEERYDFDYPPPPMLVPRYLRVEIEERIDKNGQVYTALSEEDVRRACALFKQEGVEAVAVCYLWSFLNPVHEARTGEIVLEELPGVFLTLSHEVLPQIREYDRTSTTAVNAFVGPKYKRYLEDVERLFRSYGYQGEIRFMQSNGGVASGQAIAKRPVLALNSGPAAGPVAGLFFGKMIDKEDVLTIDMGGTSFDVCLVEKGTPDIVKSVDVQRYRVGVPMVNINTIGAGGGSIAWIDAGGLLQVGPQSAEAVPGPVCYMKGGNEPTVTDANVALGYLNPDYLLGGEVKINGEASKAAVRLKIADPLKIGTEEAALGIFNIVNRNMTAAISQVSVERGHDPRDFVLVVAGGAGPIHAGRLAAELDIPHVIIPKIASAFCAFGETVTDVRHDFLWSYASRVKDLDLELLGRRFEEMEARGYEELSKEGFKPEEIEITRSLDMRYADQIHECTVTIPSGKITEEWVPEVEEAFHRRHEQLYTYCERDNLSEVINIGASLCGRVPRIELARLPKGTENPSKAFKGERLAYFEEQGRFVNTPIYDGERIETGNVIEGPAVIEEVTTTIVVFPKSRLVLDERGFYLLSF